MGPRCIYHTGFLNRFLNVEALVGTFNQEKALAGALSVIVKTDGSLQLYTGPYNSGPDIQYPGYQLCSSVKSSKSDHFCTPSQLSTQNTEHLKRFLKDYQDSEMQSVLNRMAMERLEVQFSSLKNKSYYLMR